MRRAKLTALLTAAALLGAGALAAAPALASHDETVFFEAPNALLTPATREPTIRQLQSLGVHALRVIVYWRDVAPDPNHGRRPNFNQANPAAYHWGAYDPLIAAATALHWRILLTVSGPVPRWATPHGEDIYSDPNTTDFGKFMQAVGKHYGRQVKLYSIWNEPNEPGFLRPQYTHGRLASAAIYRGLFIAGYNGLKASGNFSGMTVLMGETSPTGVASQGVPAPLAFLVAWWPGRRRSCRRLASASIWRWCSRASWLVRPGCVNMGLSCLSVAGRLSRPSPAGSPAWACAGQRPGYPFGAAAAAG